MNELILRNGPPLRRALLVLLVVVMPLIFLYGLMYDPVNTPKLAFLIALVATVSAVKLLELGAGASARSLRPLLVPALAVVAPLGAAWLVSPYRGWALLGQYNRYQGLVPYVLTALFGVLAADAFRGRARTLAWALLISGAAVGAYAVLEAFHLAPFIWTGGGTAETFGLDNAASTLGNPNFLGGFMSIVLPVGIGVWLVDREHRDWAGVCVVLAAAGWFVSFSQGAWLAGVAGVAVTLGLVLRRRWGWAPVAGLVIACALAAAGVGVIVFTMIKGESGEIGITAAHRAWAWEAAIDMAADHPVLGRGPNVYAVESIQHRSPDEALQADYVTDDPHSVFFAFLTSAGVVGALGFLVLLGWTVARGWRVETGTDAGILAACFFGGAIAYFTQSLLSLDELSTRLALWTVLAGFVAAAGLPEREPEVRPRPGAVRVLAGAVAVLLVAASFWWSARIVMADRHYKFGNEHAQDNLADEAVDEFRAAVADRSDYYYLAGMAKHVGELGTRRGAAGAPYIDEMRRAFASLNGFPLITAITAEAQLLHVWGVNVEPAADEEALALYERAMALNPGSPLLVAEASDVYISLGREEDALARLDRFAAEPVPFARYWGTLALVNAKLGNDDAARDAAATAAEIDPEDPRAKEALDLLASAPGT